MLRLGQSVLLVLTVAGLSVGQILFKLAALRMDDTASLWSRWIFNPPMITALVVYGLATLCWVSVLRAVPLHLAYPFAALAFFIVPVLSHFLLGEEIRLQTLVGAGIIGLGVWVSVT